MNLRALAGSAAPAQPATPKPRGFVAVRSLPVLYVNMPKSGCTTIKNVLHRLDSGAWLDDPLTVHRRKDLFVRPEREPDEIARRLGRDLVFTFVRHPLRRAYSCFNEKVHFETEYSFARLRRHLADAHGARFVAAPPAELHRENFKAFLRFATLSFKGANGWRADPHWCPQVMVLKNVRRWRAVDFIGRVERLDVELKTVLGLAGVIYELATPRMNEGPPPPWRYEEVVDAEVKALGRALFAADLKSFGYSL